MIILSGYYHESSASYFVKAMTSLINLQEAPTKFSQPQGEDREFLEYIDISDRFPMSRFIRRLKPSHSTSSPAHRGKTRRTRPRNRSRTRRPSDDHARSRLRAVMSFRAEQAVRKEHSRFLARARLTNQKSASVHFFINLTSRGKINMIL